MQIIPINRKDTFFSNQFTEDFYTNKFDELRTYSPNIDGLKKASEGRKGFALESRTMLVNALVSQYAKAGIELSSDSLVNQNIELLRLPNTFTVTTGQQIHIGLGPLYVAYKTFETIAICKELKELNPYNNYVPVFWMASEDHDIEEIRSIHVFGKSFDWETNQTGAVGRMRVEGISELFIELENSLNLNYEQKEFIGVCKNAYDSGTLADGFRRLLHYYFQSEGVLILDGDDVKLKQSFLPVILDELHKKNASSLKASTEKLESLGIERQIVVRDINLFTLRNNKRLKITSNGSEWLDEDGKKVATKSNFNNEVLENISDFSPNAALRPLYQEWVLPNIVYVGGGSEAKYWLQLKALFDNYNLPVPLTHLRSSEVIIPKKRFDKLALEEPTDLFISDEELIKKYGDELSEIREDLFGQLKSLEDGFEFFAQTFEKAFDGATINKKTDKILPKIKEIVEITTSQLMLKSNTSSRLDKVLKTKVMYCNPLQIQERTEHCTAYIGVLMELKSISQTLFGIKKSALINLLLA